ncbi:UNVERIFIED_CONTAM: hypothetical protein Slati_3079100 [Sesamum latifolium]|uniref:Retrotransposon Copia-like N-terminal domain-containing protein n=1 Tax=Sesamum latifolium TaxID=2727402 RepID=A0AAW2UUV0_9LAMI
MSARVRECRVNLRKQTVVAIAPRSCRKFAFRAVDLPRHSDTKPENSARSVHGCFNLKSAARSVQTRLNGTNYKRWSQKLLIFFEQLDVDYVLFTAALEPEASTETSSVAITPVITEKRPEEDAK